MNTILFLIPVALLLGGLGLAAFIWSLRNNQFEDLDGSAWRILLDDEEAVATRSQPAANTDQPVPAASPSQES